MQTSSRPQPDPSRRLESWKEIAAYLNASVRTVQRWEEQNGLPVRRVLRDQRAAVFAMTGDLDAWLAGRTQEPSATPISAGVVATKPVAAANPRVAKGAVPLARAPLPVPTLGITQQRRRRRWAIAAGLALVAALAAGWWWRLLRHLR
ncbi:MAG: hypothetical protein NTZ56_20765 [Acidobacteria bacterium]|nr:hypothetical protein [Acidobacteriota bacterium]